MLFPLTKEQSRRAFLKENMSLLAALLPFHARQEDHSGMIMTVRGPIAPATAGKSLIHEHILVDFIGADKISFSRWQREDVIRKMLPHLIAVKRAGFATFYDCTPNFLGRDARLLKSLSERSSLNIVTNTGYYGGSDQKFLPKNAFKDSPEEMAEQWIREFIDGIDGTTVRPGFIKISVNNSNLSAVSTKLVSAAALTHKETGLTIASHTGPALPALEQLEILKDHGVKPDAFIWVHAQVESDRGYFAAAARRGCWVSLDGLSPERVNEYVNHILFMKREGCLHRTLISHDAGWYDPAQKDGGRVRDYLTLTRDLIPALIDQGLKSEDLEQLLVKNPQDAFTLRKDVLE